MRINFVLGLILLQLLIIGNIQAQADFFTTQHEGCTEFPVKFIIDYNGIDPSTITSVKWHFGIGDTIVAENHDSITFTFRQSGQYTVVMVLNNQKSTAIVKTNFITVHETVYATFDVEQLGTAYRYKFTPNDPITDTGANYTYTWSYVNVESGVSNTHIYNIDYNTWSSASDTFTFDTGIYRVNLQITDSYGCTSTYEEALTIAEEIILPNVFVPPVHEFFIINPQDINIVLLFKLFNRNGMIVFQQEAPIINWNGKSSWGSDLNTGVYFYVLKATSGDPLERYSKKGFIHLYR
jgi:hypothetical protein